MFVTRLIIVTTWLGACCTALPAGPFPQVDEDTSKAAIDGAREKGKQLAGRLKLAFVEKETPHFLVYTDWSKSDLNGLSAQLEQTYAAVARQFGIGAKDGPVFVGKLLVIAVGDRTKFVALALDFDDANPPEDLAGYFRPHEDGSGHLLVCRPALAVDASQIDRERARERFSAMLARELTLAFLDRYADKAALPNWLNRGLAMMVQRSIVPNERIDPAVVRYLASSRYDLTIVFDPDLPAGPHFDAAALSLVEMLLERDRAAFVAMLERLRSGGKADVAFEESFGLTYQEAAEQWRHFIQTR